MAPSCLSCPLRGRAFSVGVSTMAGKTPGKPAKAAKPVLLSGGNPQIAKGTGDAPVQAYIAAMPGWKSDLGRRLDALITATVRSEEHTSELQSLMRISYAVFCLQKKNKNT